MSGVYASKGYVYCNDSAMQFHAVDDVSEAQIEQAEQWLNDNIQTN